MPKTKISEFDVDPANNTDINSINIAEGCAPSGINNAIRQLMSDLKEFQTGAGGDPFNGAVNGTVGATTPNTGAFTTLSASSTATLNTLSSSGATITGGSINGTTVGASTASTGAFTSLSASGAFSANGGATLGDASGDALTINSSAVSIPNGLNFDSNTLVIDAANNRVGIGTASPESGFSLHVVGNAFVQNPVGQTVGKLVVDNADNRLVLGSYFESGVGQYSYISSTDNAETGNIPLLFRTGTSERMRIDSSGNVGIGTSSPSYKLQVTNSTGIDTELAVTNSAGLSRYGTRSSGNAFAGAFTSGKSFELWSGGSLNATLDSSGNLGLGVTPFANTLSVGIDLSQGGGLFGYSNSTYLTANSYYNSGWKYKATAAASRYEQYLGSHAWHTAPSGTAGNAITFTQAMTLDASGNLGIGTSSPDAKLHVQRSNDGTIGIFRGTSNAQLLLGISSGNLVYDSSNGNGTHVWQSNTTERMRIDSSGNLLVGMTNTGGSGVAVFPDLDTGGSINVRKGAAPSGSRFVIFDVSGVQIGSITYNGSGTNYNTSSDYRLKNITGDLTGYKERIMALQPKQGSWKTDGSVFKGFIAHEFAEQYPNAVSGEKDAVDANGKPVYQGMQAGGSETIADLVALVKEQQAIITDLKARIETLESK